MKQEQKLLNTLDKGMSLKEVSKLLDIPASTLRFWDKEGLVTFERNGQNDYRQVSLDTLISLLDVLYYREMGLPIEQIRQTATMTTDELLDLLSQSRQALITKITKLEQIINKINLESEALHHLQKLASEPPKQIYKQMPTIYQADLSGAEGIREYLTAMHSVDLLNANNPDAWQAGLWQAEKLPILRPADTQTMPYLHGILYFSRDGKDNRRELCQSADELGYQPQAIISQLLATAYHPEYGLCDFYECWVELVEKA